MATLHKILWIRIDNIQTNGNFQQSKIKVNAISVDLNTTQKVFFQQTSILLGFSFYIPHQFQEGINTRKQLEKYNLYTATLRKKLWIKIDNIIQTNGNFQQSKIKVNAISIDLNTTQKVFFQQTSILLGFSFYIPQQFQEGIYKKIAGELQIVHNNTP